MRVAEAYLDTSALIILSVGEACSTEVEQFVAAADGIVISRLSMLEWHCALARRLRTGQITKDYMNLARTEFTRHLAEGYFRIELYDDPLLSDALRVLDSTHPIPLRTLDTIPLAAARNAGLARIATADDVLRLAAQQLQLEVAYFVD